MGSVIRFRFWQSLSDSSIRMKSSSGSEGRRDGKAEQAGEEARYPESDPRAGLEEFRISCHPILARREYELAAASEDARRNGRIWAHGQFHQGHSEDLQALLFFD